MDITTTIRTVAKRHDGGSTVLERTVTSHHGDNPRFERAEVASALKKATSDFVTANHLGETVSL